MNKLMRIAAPIAILALAAIVVWQLDRWKPRPETREVVVPVPSVEVLVVEPRTVAMTVASQGTVEPRTESRLVPEVSGRVVRVARAFESGGFFARGDVLVEVDPYDYRQAVVQRRADVARARLRLEQERAEEDLARREWEQLGEGDASPLTLRVPQIEDAEATLASAEAALERSERDLERTTLRAPFAGRVRSTSVDVGQYVNRGEPLGLLYAIDVAQVRLPVKDGDFAFFEAPLGFRGARSGRGADVELAAEFAGGEHRWRGTIVRTEAEIDPTTRFAHVIAEVPDPYGRGVPGRPPLAVGMFVEAEIVGHTVEGVIELPRPAVRDGDVVLVVDDEDRLRFRDVAVLRRGGESVWVVDGLERGERVAVTTLQAVTDGMRVAPVAETDAREVASSTPIEDDVAAASKAGTAVGDAEAWTADAAGAP